jgi:outer membrane protein
MKIRQTVACALGIVMLASAPVHAETLEEIYNLAVINDPQLGSAQAVFLSQNEVVTQSRARILPNVALVGQTSDNMRAFPTNPRTPSSNFNDHNWAAVLNQPIFRLDSWFTFLKPSPILLPNSRRC